MVRLNVALGAASQRYAQGLLEAFRFLMRSRQFKNHPFALETPKSDDLHEDVENIAMLKSLL